MLESMRNPSSVRISSAQRDFSVIEKLGAFRDAGCVHLTGYYADAVWGDSLPTEKEVRR